MIIKILQEDILNKIIETHARGVLIDVSALDIMDSFMARTLRDSAIMAGLIGAKVVVTGIQPAVAITLIELGLKMNQVYTANNLDHGFEILNELITEEDFKNKL